MNIILKSWVFYKLELGNESLIDSFLKSTTSFLLGNLLENLLREMRECLISFILTFILTFACDR